MIISRAEIESAMSAYRVGVRRKKTVVSLEPVAAFDSFDASSDLRSIASLRDSVISDPFYRPDLVSDLRRRVEEGRYYVPADQIVEKMLGRLVAEALPA